MDKVVYTCSTVRNARHVLTRFIAVKWPMVSLLETVDELQVVIIIIYYYFDGRASSDLLYYRPVYSSAIHITIYKIYCPIVIKISHFSELLVPVQHKFYFTKRSLFSCIEHLFIDYLEINFKISSICKSFFFTLFSLSWCTYTLSWNVCYTYYNSQYTVFQLLCHHH